MKNLERISSARGKLSHGVIESSENRLLFICGLLTVVGGLTILTLSVSGNRLAILNLFFLPVILSAFYLRKQQINLVAFVSSVAVVLTTTVRLSESSLILTPGVIGFSVILWAAALGLTALLVGSLSTKYTRTIEALHEARVSVIDLLNQYLHGANPQLYRNSKRIADRVVDVATRLGMSDSKIDSMRVACLLHDMEQVEITARAAASGVTSQPVSGVQSSEQITFLGVDLADSLGRTMTDVYPLLIRQRSFGSLVRQRSFGSLSQIATLPPLTAGFERAASIICTVRAFDTIAHDSYLDRADAIDTLAADLDIWHPPAVIQALRASILNEPKKRTWKHLLGRPASTRNPEANAAELSDDVSPLRQEREIEIHAQL